MKHKRLLFATLVASFMLIFSISVLPASAAEEIYYLGEGSTTVESRTINYSSLLRSTTQTSTKVPSFVGTDSATNSNNCGAIAGANVVGFYDIVHTNMIPNLTVGRVLMGNYMFNVGQSGTEIQRVINNLYYGMNTNSSQAGVTQADFMAGLNSYIGGQGYTMSTSKINNGDSIDRTKLQSSIKSKNISIIFMSRHNYIANITDTGSSLKFDIVLSTTPHIAVVYGYETFSMVVNGMTIDETFLKVATSASNPGLVYIRLNDFLTIENFVNVSIT